MRCISSLLLLAASALPLSAAVSIEGAANDWRFAIDGKPFYVHGVTWGGGKYNEAAWRADFTALQGLGVNAVRTWGCGDETGKLLDLAHEHGIKVMAGLWMRHGRVGAEGDDVFNWITDTAGKQGQYDGNLAWVAKYKDHPALLCWGVGNEVILNIGPEEEKIAYSEFLGKLTAEIKKLDPHHPIASVDAWTMAWPYWKKYAPAIDIYAVNTYGYGAPALVAEQDKLAINHPYMITEYGATGEWETKEDGNGVRMDPTDQEKYGIIATGFPDMIGKFKGRNLGGFVFHFGNSFDSTGLWLGMRSDGLLRPAWHGVMKAFTGKDPANKLPVIATLQMDKDSGKPDDWLPVVLDAKDPEGAELRVRFAFNDRKGDRAYRDSVQALESRKTAAGWDIRLPGNIDNKGIKIYALVDDGVNLALAQKSVFVGARAAGSAPLGAKVFLPFPIYAEGNEGHGFVASGMMGNSKDLKLDFTCADRPYSGSTCLRLTYSAKADWCGVTWQKPVNDWGAKPGGIDVSGAKRFRAMVRGGEGGEKISISFGLIGKNQPYYDSAKIERKDIALTKDWQKIEIPLDGADLTHIKTPLAFFLGGIGRPMTIDLDEVVIE